MPMKWSPCLRRDLRSLYSYQRNTPIRAGACMLEWRVWHLVALSVGELRNLAIYIGLSSPSQYPGAIFSSAPCASENGAAAVFRAVAEGRPRLESLRERVCDRLSVKPMHVFCHPRPCTARRQRVKAQFSFGRANSTSASRGRPIPFFFRFYLKNSSAVGDGRDASAASFTERRCSRRLQLQRTRERFFRIS